MGNLKGYGGGSPVAGCTSLARHMEKQVSEDECLGTPDWVLFE
jgi:hypothetical protein